MSEDRAQAFLQLIRKSERGRLKVYLGYGPGVGKTFQMLSEAHRLLHEGIDVVIGLVETHDRPATAALLKGLEILPRRRVEYRGIVVEEMDLDAVIARHPQVVIVDELAHTNVPGGRNVKRYLDVQDILSAGIHVISAMNIQHLESLYNTVQQLVGVKVRERIPDSVLIDADQVVNIDLSAQDLQERLREGKIYPRDRIASSLENFFTASNLEHLRELTLRELASQLDSRRRESGTVSLSSLPHRSPDQIMVCLSSRGPDSARLLRFASRLAGRLNRNWYAVYVQTPSEEPTVIDAKTQRLLSDTLTLANQLGAMVFTFKGQDVPDTILRFAREYRVGQVVIGRPHPIPWWKRWTGTTSVAEQLLHRSDGVTLVVVDADSDENTHPAPSNSSGKISTGAFGKLLNPNRILIWSHPVSKNDVIDGLARLITADNPQIDVALLRQKITDRESQGSTFLNEGIALPHARLEQLHTAEIALGLTHAGVLDAPGDHPIEVVFLLLSPMDNAGDHLQLLGKAARLLQNRDVRSALRNAHSPAQAVQAISRALGDFSSSSL